MMQNLTLEELKFSLKMIWKILSLVGLAVAVLGDDQHAISEQKVVIHHSPVHYGHHGELSHVGSHAPDHHEEYAWTYPSYEFSYKVNDPHTHDYKGQHEMRHGDEVKGMYWLIQPDGRKRTVQYHADKHNGFNADVQYSEPIYSNDHKEHEEPKDYQKDEAHYTPKSEQHVIIHHDPNHHSEDKKPEHHEQEHYEQGHQEHGLDEKKHHEQKYHEEEQHEQEHIEQEHHEQEYFEPEKYKPDHRKPELYVHVRKHNVQNKHQEHEYQVLEHHEPEYAHKHRIVEYYERNNHGNEHQDDGLHEYNEHQDYEPHEPKYDEVEQHKVHNEEENHEEEHHHELHDKEHRKDHYNYEFYVHHYDHHKHEPDQHKYENHDRHNYEHDYKGHRDNDKYPYSRIHINRGDKVYQPEH